MPRFVQEVGYVDDWPVIYEMQLLKNTRGVVAGTGASGILCLWLGGTRDYICSLDGVCSERCCTYNYRQPISHIWSSDV